MIRRKYIMMTSLLIIAVSIAGFVYGVHSFNAQAGLTIQKGVAKVIVIDTFSPGLNLGQTNNQFFYYDFEPLGTLINVTGVYYNFFYSGGSPLSPNAQNPSNHIINFAPNQLTANNNSLLCGLIFQDNWNFAGGSNDGYNYGRHLNFTQLIHQGVNYLSIMNSQNGGPLHIYRFELMIEYYYFP